ncbi:MAG: hypothetical protein N4A40_06715 [Tissierellales bacterium]|jgi:hypothetical protein|nr:hypothetical protein [Tissierellales bacterium]
MKIGRKTITTIISILGIIVSIFLVSMEFITESFCPLFWGVPACYLVLVSFLLVRISQFDWDDLRIKIICFYAGGFSGIGLAVWFSYNQLLGFENCPSFMEIPLCYVSLVAFLIILLLGREKS